MERTRSSRSSGRISMPDQHLDEIFVAHTCSAGPLKMAGSLP